MLGGVKSTSFTVQFWLQSSTDQNPRLVFGFLRLKYIHRDCFLKICIIWKKNVKFFIWTCCLKTKYFKNTIFEVNISSKPSKFLILFLHLKCSWIFSLVDLNSYANAKILKMFYDALNDLPVYSKPLILIVRSSNRSILKPRANEETWKLQKIVKWWFLLRN